MLKKILGILVICSLVTFVSHGAAAGEESEETKSAGLGITLGARAVVSFSQVFSKLGVTPGGDLEVGYILPPLQGRLALSVAGGYLWAKASGSGQDPRLVNTGGAAYEGYSWEMFQHQAVFSLRIKGRIFPIDRKFTPYVYAGPSLYLLWSVVKADADGENFGTSTERSTKPGAHGGAGVEYVLGPGRLFGEICIAWSPLDHDVTGKKSTGNLGVGIGYLFVF